VVAASGEVPKLLFPPGMALASQPAKTEADVVAMQKLRAAQQARYCFIVILSSI
jgi:hypothetical protein